MLEHVLKAIDSRKQQSLESLKEFLRIPSVSTKPDHKPDMMRCANWLKDQLARAKLDVQVMPTAGHPCAVAKNEHVAGRPTILFYGHYDVQPPEPLDLWNSPPFEPTVRKDEDGFDAVYARGAVDDKGQVWCHIEAVTAWQKTGGLPINLIMLIEGEEEIGSENLAEFVKQHKNLLKSDLCLISDTDQFRRGLPAITYGLRGLVYEEVKITGPDHDLHSGMYGGAVPNPANVLCEILATLHNADGSVNIPGFYDDVETVKAEEKSIWAKLPHEDKDFAKQLGLAALSGEAGYSTLERTWVRPTCDINGLSGGYQGPGAKTVIGSWASAKVSMRLVPKQDPKKIQAAFRMAIRDRAPRNVKVEFTLDGHNALPVVVPIDNKATRLAAEA